MATLVEIAEELHKDLENLQYSGKTVTVKFKLHTFESEPGCLEERALPDDFRQDASPISQEIHLD